MFCVQGLHNLLLYLFAHIMVVLEFIPNGLLAIPELSEGTVAEASGRCGIVRVQIRAGRRHKAPGPFLVSMWETWMLWQAPDFHLVGPAPLVAIWKVNQRMEYFSVFHVEKNVPKPVSKWSMSGKFYIPSLKSARLKKISFAFSRCPFHIGCIVSVKKGVVVTVAFLFLGFIQLGKSWKSEISAVTCLRGLSEIHTAFSLKAICFTLQDNVL